MADTRRAPGYQRGRSDMLRPFAVPTISLLAVLVAQGSPAWGASACSGNKLKSAGKKAAAKLTGLSKGVSKGIPSDSTCLAKADVKYSSTVAKAEAKTYTDTGCLTLNDAATVGAAIDTLYGD